MLEQEQDKEDVIYHLDITTVSGAPVEFNICFSWQDPLEEPSNKEVNPHIEKLVYQTPSV